MGAGLSCFIIILTGILKCCSNALIFTVHGGITFGAALFHSVGP